MKHARPENAHPASGHLASGRSILSFVLIVCLGISAVICGKGVLESLASRKVDAWLSEQPVLFTSQLTDEQRGEFISALQDFSRDHEFVLISRSSEVQQTGSMLYTFSVFTSPSIDAISIEPLVLMGTTITDKALIQKVAAAEIDGYAGYGNDAFKSVASMPSIRSGVNFRVDRLESDSSFGTTCRVIGLSQEDFRELLGRLASSTGMSEESLTTQMSGSTSTLGLIYLFSGGAFVILSIVLCLLMLTSSLLDLKTLGVYMMLGWSKVDHVLKLFSAQVMQLLVVVPISAVGMCLMLDGFTPNFMVFEYACATMLPTVLIVLASMGIAAVPVVTVKPVDAIASRYSRRGFYVVVIASYLICLVAIFAGCLAIDQPLQMYRSLLNTRSSWSDYGDWYVLRDFWMDDSMFTGDPMGFSKDVYTWYAAHEHDDGVFVAMAGHYNDDTIHAYVPEDTQLRPFWYLAASPSYLRQVGIDVSDEDVARAERGVRVYLLPDSLDASQVDAMERLLRSSAKPVASNITTAFMEDPTYEFSSYDGRRQLFTWSTGDEQPTTADNFVIAVVTANNMVPLESESLVASGLENSYLKLSEGGASRLLDDEGQLSVNGGSLKARFASVTNYINGLTKSLEELFVLFSVVMLMMAATIAVMLVCLVNVVNRVREREIGVKYVLGFSAWDMYRKEILFVNLAIVVGIVVCGVARCTAGLVIGAALLAFSNLVMLGMVRRNSVGVVLETVSKE